MEIQPVAYYHCSVGGKFGLPRQSSLAPSLQGTVVLEKAFASADALRGLEDFDFCHLIWGFSLSGPENTDAQGSAPRLTVRPPRLGGNTRIGVFASRSPFRPNGLGLSSVRIESVDMSSCTIHVLGADLADGTPIYDIKPYIEYADAHTGIRSGFVDSSQWQELEVRFSDEARSILTQGLRKKYPQKDIQREIDALTELLRQDPRPAIQRGSSKEFALVYAGMDVHFTVTDNILEVICINI